MKLYGELAEWWPLISPPEEYEEEATLYASLLKDSAGRRLSMVEFGSGGGSNAFHLKRDFDITLVDLSPEMLRISERINPECPHQQGDMREVRLGRAFDRVFIHDALCYLTTVADLRSTFTTAWEHLKPGGLALFVPDYVRETFREHSELHGFEGEGRATRYAEWMHDPDPNDSTYIVDYAFLLREGAEVRVVHDRHIEGLFPRDLWLQELTRVGFVPQHQPVEPWSEDDLTMTDLFLARRPE